MASLFSRKPIADLMAEADNPNALRRMLGAGDLIMLAIGAVIGAGIFGAIGSAAAGEIGQRRGRAKRCRTGARALVPPPRLRLRARGALLRRARGDDSAGWQRVRLFVRHARRVRGVDHRLGSHSRVRGGQRRRRDLVVRLLQDAPRRHGDGHSHRGSRPDIAPRF